MAETVNQENNTANETQEERTFTQSQLDAIIQAGCDGNDLVFQLRKIISIHAPRGGVRLYYFQDSVDGRYNFNPRTPCGVRLLALPFLFCRE